VLVDIIYREAVGRGGCGRHNGIAWHAIHPEEMTDEMSNERRRAREEVVQRR